jgi:predicted RNase H-like HicB family nuclease
MERIKFIYYQENDIWVGWLEEYPDYRRQGTTLDELKENLKDIYEDLSTGKIPHARNSSSASGRPQGVKTALICHSRA